MQPYFLPYIGYFQLIAAVDLFIVYDNIEYTKRGWVNRNRLCRDGGAVTFTVPLKRASDYLNVCEREVAPGFNREKLLNQIKGAYSDASEYVTVFPLVERIVNCEENNLFLYLHNSIRCVCEYLEVETAMRLSSSIAIDHKMKGQDKVLALCRAVGADTYLNAIGGTDLYSRDTFGAQGIRLKFLRAKPFVYAQSGGSFIPSLSILDVMMRNPAQIVRERVASHYEVI